jgi:hypothetical protein
MQALRHHFITGITTADLSAEFGPAQSGKEFVKGHGMKGQAVNFAYGKGIRFPVQGDPQ